MSNTATIFSSGMPLILTPYKVVTYVEGMEGRVPAEHRLSLVRWKAPTEKELTKNPEAKKKASVCVALPAIVLTVEPRELRSAMMIAVEDLQDSAVRAFVEEKLLATPGISLASIVIPVDLGTAGGLAAFSAKKTISARMTTEGLKTWFDTVMAGPLIDLIVSKLPEATQNMEDVAMAQVEKAKAVIATLASPKVSMPIAVASQLARALNATVVIEQDRTAQLIMKKLDFFINPPSTDELLLSI